MTMKNFPTMKITWENPRPTSHSVMIIKVYFIQMPFITFEKIMIRKINDNEIETCIYEIEIYFIRLNYKLENKNKKLSCL